MGFTLRKYITIILSIVLMGGVFYAMYYFYSETEKEIERIQAESTNLENEIANLNKMMVDILPLREQKKQIEEQVEFILNHYAIEQSPQRGIHMVRALEQATGVKISSISFGGESNFFTSEFELDETTGPLLGYKSALVVGYEATYGNFMRLLDYIRDYPERMNIDNLSASFNSSTGYLSGTMTINQYRVEGSGRETELEREPEVPIGVDNIFGTMN